MVFKPKGTNIWKLKLAAPPRPTLSTGCYELADAEDMETQVERWLGQRGKKYARPDVIQALAAKRITLADAYDAALGGTLDDEMAKLEALANVVDLAPLVDGWHAEKRRAKKGAKSADNYRRQLRRLFPEDQPFHLTSFTRRDVKARLDALTGRKGRALDNPTRNRYRAAVSSFAKYLVEQELLETNFMRDVASYGENDARMVYYERREAKKLVGALEEPFSGIAAFACGFCAEWVAIATLQAGDLDLTRGHERAYVRGTKGPKRLRWVPLVEENRWVVPYLKRAVAGKLPDALVFAGISETRALRAQKKTARLLKITAAGEDVGGQHTLHDWRHTHTVQLLRDGYGEQIAAAHLGDAVDMVSKVYGQFKPGKEDYARKGRGRFVGDQTSKRLEVQR